jgi:DNA mismatch endonuclease (patch repair protein)
MDSLSKEHRSWNMSQIRSKDTSPEKIVRSMLHDMGYRFRLHRKDLPGKPDIVLPKYKTVIEVRGCFWHRHKGCKEATMPKSNQDFWLEKFSKNVKRDRKNERKLKALGWKVIVIWECEIKDEEKLASRLTAISNVPCEK